jgi:hypothetical protein
MDQKSSKDCPRCGLTNPGSAERCDCGYDFQSMAVEKPYFKQGIPKDIRLFIKLVIILNVVGAFLALTSGDTFRIVWVAIWSVIVYWLYANLLKKKNWARIGLAIATFPAGIALALSKEARLYCLQKDAPKQDPRGDSDPKAT